jgi:Zn-dependent protease
MKKIFEWILENVLRPLALGSIVIILFLAFFGILGLLFYINVWLGGIVTFILLALMLGSEIING